MRTILSRIVGVMYSFVYIFYGGMQTGQSVVNGPVGSVMSFLCFDENTKINTFNGIKAIKDVQIGDRLSNNLSLVTSVYKLDGKGIPMYNLSGIFVTGSHKVKYNGKYIRVDNHPYAVKSKKESTNLVCLNTNTHKISIRNYEFLDFVESEDSTFVDFKNSYIQNLYNAKPTDTLFGKQTGLIAGAIIPLNGNLQKEIQDIEVGDILDNGDVVKGVCKHLVNDGIYVELDNGILATPSTWVYKDNSIIKAETYGRIQKYDMSPLLYVYQLITEHSMYPVINHQNNRIMILDELETTEPFYHAMKDTIITAGRFRSKVIVV